MIGLYLGELQKYYTILYNIIQLMDHNSVTEHSKMLQ